MSETPAQQQYREAVESLQKLEPWRLAEIRRELNITPPKPTPGSGGCPSGTLRP